MSAVGKRRLQKEYAELAKAPPPFIIARPYESNLWETHFIVRGPPDSPYAGGEYHGTLTFTDQYPFAPPAVRMVTPSGRFKTATKICFSMSDYHPQTWVPSWSIASILTGLLSFMLEDEVTAGSIRTSDSEKRVLAAKSHAFNLTQTKFKTVFPDYAGPTTVDLPNMPNGSAPASAAVDASPALPATDPRDPGVAVPGGAPEAINAAAPTSLRSVLVVLLGSLVAAAVLSRLVS